MKKIIIAITILFVCTTSCKKSFFDVNTDPNNPQEATPDLRLPPILYNLHNRYGGAGTRTAMLTQQYGSPAVSTTNYYKLQNWEWADNVEINTWQGWYVYIYVNIPKLYAEAKKYSAEQYIGVGKLLEAFGWSLVSDMYGQVIFTDALSTTTLTPKFDDIKEVYPKLLTMIDEGINVLKTAAPSALYPLSKGDYIYNGDTQKWIKFGYALKARLLNHLVKKSTYDPATILTLVSQAYSSNDEDTEIKTFTESTIVDEWNVLYQNAYTTSTAPTANGNTTIRYGKLLLQYLNNTFPGGSGIEDPRMNLMVNRIPTGALAGQYSKAVDLDFASTAPTTTDLDYRNPVGSFFVKKTSRFAFMNFAELKFIEAEAAFRSNNKTRALTAYKDGIKAHMDKMGIDPTVRNTFLASAAVAQTEATLTLSNIMMQKYIILFQNPEAWTDMRKCDYCLNANGDYDEAAGIYKGFKKPKFVHVNFSDPKAWVRRFQTAYIERSYNVDNVRAIGGFEPTYTAKPVWWDIKE
jgi:hypothetical protein